MIAEYQVHNDDKLPSCRYCEGNKELLRPNCILLSEKYSVGKINDVPATSARVSDFHSPHPEGQFSDAGESSGEDICQVVLFG